MITLCPWDGSTVGFLDLPDPPDEPGRPERASMSGADRPALKPRELPGPDERGRVYEAMRAQTPAETAGESSDAAGESRHDQQTDAAGRRDYRGEVPRFMAMWTDHETSGRRPADHSGSVRTHQHRTTGTANSGSAQNGRRKRPRRSAGSVGPSPDSRRTRKPSSRRIRTRTAAGWRASSTGSRVRTASKRRLPKGWRVSQTNHRPRSSAKSRTPCAIRSASSRRTIPGAITT